nr:hypothetical protein [Agitococcus sp.]
QSDTPLLFNPHTPLLMIAPFTLAENNSNVIFYGIWRAIGVEQKAVLCRVNFTNGLLFLDLILVYFKIIAVSVCLGWLSYSSLFSFC